MQQAKKLRESLVGYVAAGKLTADRVEMAFVQGKRTELTATVGRDVLQACDPAWKRALLADAYAEFAQNVQKVVSNAIHQLEERLDVLKAEPTARTLPGITKELQSRVDAVRDSQAKKAQTDSLWGLYADFPLVKSRVQEAAQRHFDHALAAVTRRLAEDLRAGAKQLPDEDEHVLERDIRSDVRAHHAAASSRELLKPKIETMVAADRRWIVASAKISVETAHSPFDAEFGQQDAQDIDRFLELPKSLAGESWLALKSLLREQYEKAVSKARSTVAVEQAEKHAPGLASKTWRPTEREIGDDSRQPVDPARLRTLSIWNGAPPADHDVLEETWDIWTAGARAGIEIGKQAMTAQNNVVDRLRDQMADRMHTNRGWSAADWINEYSAVVQGEWQQNGGPVSGDYPRLFDATRQRIRAVVSELLATVARDLEDEAKRRAADAQSQKAADRRDKGEAEQTERPAGHVPLAEKKDPQGVGPSPTGIPQPAREAQGHEHAPTDPPGGKQTGGAGSSSVGTSGANGTSQTGTGAGGSPGKTGLGNGGSGTDGNLEAQKTWYDRGYRHGYDTGYGDGYDEGYADGYGHGYGDDPYGLYYTVYPIGFWGLVIIAIIMAGCWYWNIKYLRAYYNARTTTDVDSSRQTRNLQRVLGARGPKKSPDAEAG